METNSQQPDYTAVTMPSKKQLLLHFLLPSGAEFLTYTVVSIIFLLACNLWALIQVMTGDTSLNALQLGNALATYKEQVDAVFNKPIFASVSVFVLWGIIGCIAYMGAFVIKSYLERLYEDKTASQNIQPRYIKNNEGYWKSVASHNIFFACTVLVTIVFLVLALGSWVPYCITLFNHGLADLFSWQSFVALIGSTLLLVILIQVARILFRLIHNSWKIYFATEE